MLIVIEHFSGTLQSSIFSLLSAHPHPPSIWFLLGDLIRSQGVHSYLSLADSQILILAASSLPTTFPAVSWTLLLSPVGNFKSTCPGSNSSPPTILSLPRLSHPLVSCTHHSGSCWNLTVWLLPNLLIAPLLFIPAAVTPISLSLPYYWLSPSRCPNFHEKEQC